ncbi:MAG TPA: MbtH family NRPS accessory protein [Pyrinomonadaceae bacterium]|nr:MbtH family NRPS accessory protein [Pyrinomonadaceae bacterium]
MKAPLIRLLYLLRPVPSESTEFREALRHKVAWTQGRNETLRQQFSLGTYERYDWDQDRGVIVFSAGGEAKVIADIQFVGTISYRTKTWLWAWSNASLDGLLTKDSRFVRELGEKHGYAKLTVAKWRATEIDAWEMTAVQAELTNAAGTYRSLQQNRATFLTLHNVRWANERTATDAGPEWEGVLKENFFVELGADSTDHLLDDWRWKVGDEAAIFRVTVFGDVFTQTPDGHIYLLDTGRGNYVEAAEDAKKWAELVEIRPDWFRWNTLQELRSLGVELPPGKVFSWQHFPMAGGSEAVGNIDWVSPTVHISVSGQLAEAIKKKAAGQQGPRDEGENTALYNVVTNSELQYSIWLVGRELPSGWKSAGKTGTKQECLKYINEVWTDMRPLSLRNKMKEASANRERDALSAANPGHAGDGYRRP